VNVTGEFDGVAEVGATNDAVMDASFQSAMLTVEQTNDCSLLSIAGSSVFSTTPLSQSVKPR